MVRDNSSSLDGPEVGSAAIRLRGVRQNNLKGFDLDLPLGQLIVVTGLSGSGKSSLAFDTLYAEGQRRYIETFTPYARQFFDRMDKPAVDRIEHIPPAIAIEQRNAVRTTRSTVGTMTEVCDYMKALWAHLAELHCRNCGRVVRKEPPVEVWQALLKLQVVGTEVLITFDLALSQKLSTEEQLGLIGRQGFQRLLVDGQVIRLEDVASRLGSEVRGVTVVQDRLRLAPNNRARFIEACEQAYHFGHGKLVVHEVRPGATGQGIELGTTHRFSRGFHCAACDLDYREPTPALFSFNHPVGACPTCRGFGRVIGIDYSLALPDRTRTLAEGAIKPWLTGTGAESQADLMKFCKLRRVPTDVPFDELSANLQAWVIDGDPGYDSNDPANSWPRKWYGVKGYFRWLESKAYKMHVRVLLSRYRTYTRCPACEGRRFNPESLLYRSSGATVRGSGASEALPAAADSQTSHSRIPGQAEFTLAEFYALPIRDAAELVGRWAEALKPKAHDPLGVVLQELCSRLGYLVEVGLGYLTLDRPTRTLSGGETERVNLTTCLGTRLVNALFVLDEPSVGLHPRDTERLLRVLRRLRDQGNTVLVVEHEASVIRAADWMVDLGPGHGESGGQVMFQGPPRQLRQAKGSLTADYLAGRRRIEIPARRPVGSGAIERLPDRQPGTPSTIRDSSTPYRTKAAGQPVLRLDGAMANNLRQVSVEIPLGRFVCVTGVSGSGKTTLIREVLLPLLEEKLAGGHGTDALANEVDGESRDEARAAVNAARLTGWEALGAVVLVDQTSLGRTPRSNPGVYVGAFEDIREFFASSEAARLRGLNPSAFSFNSAVGQCERCRGAGFEKIEMQFLSDVYIRCPECQGRRYRQHILEVKVGGERRSANGKGARPRGKAQKSKLKAQSAGAGPESSEFADSGSELEWSIGDLLDATIEDAAAFLAGFPDSRAATRAVAKLQLLIEVGLGYLRTGQPINTLSGGESQRLKLATHLVGTPAAATKLTIPPGAAARLDQATIDRLNATASRASGFASGAASKPTLFLFDEPTTGLHFDDVRVLLAVFQRLVAAGHTVVVIEHNVDVIKCVDWLIDLGPDAGDQGGQVVVCGTPEDVAACEASHTGRALQSVLNLASAIDGK